MPLIKLNCSMATYLYLMDAAYDAKRFNETSRQFGHMPIIDKMVKRHSNVTQHLMVGVIVLFADQLMWLLR